MSQLFQRKPIAALIDETHGAESLKRTLGAGDLVMLAIGAVIGAGIFGAIGTAAAGQIGPNGEVVRTGAGPIWPHLASMTPSAPFAKRRMATALSSTSEGR